MYKAILVLFAFVAAASALSLAPATVTGAQVRNFEYFMSNSETVNGLLSKMSGIQGALGFNDGNYMNQIAGEIFLYADIMDANPYHSLKWQLKINLSLGVLKVIDISAKARVTNGGRTLLIVGKAFEIHQAIPQVFATQQQCHKGKRKYGIAGPKKDICNTIQVPRGLNGDEINQVNQALINKIPDALRSIGQN